jgi:PAS domain S-box-containing protein
VVLHDETDRLRSKDMILQAKEELERTFDTISDMVFLVDNQGVIRRINKALASRLGLSPREVVGRTCIEVLGVEDCHARGRERQTPDLPVRYSNLPGVFMVRSNSLFDAGGECIGKVVVARDVTASERIRETLLAVESKYKSIFDHAPVGIFQSTVEGTFLSANVTMAAMLGFMSTEEMIRHYSDGGSQMYVVPEDRARLMAEGLDKGAVTAKELQFTRRDGRTFWGRLRGRIVRGSIGEVMYFEGFLEDVTVPRAARENLAQSEHRFRSLAENMHQGLVQTDRLGLIEYCNDHFCKIVGQAREDLLFAPFSELVHREDREFCLDIFERNASFLPGARFDLRFKVEGELRFTIASPVALSTSEGESRGFWILVLDITERKLLEAQLLQTQKLEAIGQLAAGIAHEINTPVQYVVNNMWFIKEGLEQLGKALAAYRESAVRVDGTGHGKAQGPDMTAMEEELQVPFYLEEIPAAISETMQGLDRIAAIVGSVKRFAHPGHDRHSQVDLNELVTQTVTVSRNEWKYVAEMNTDLDPALPPVVCSSQEIGQVLLNLVVNAAHAIMEARGDSGEIGRITIGTRRINGMAEIRVRDSGTGIPEHARNHLFEPFFTTKPVGKGTGQGLFIAHRIVVGDHGGTIRFETETGQGTTFIISLPIEGREGITPHG